MSDTSILFFRYLKTDCSRQQRLEIKHRIRCKSKYYCSSGTGAFNKRTSATTIQGCTERLGVRPLKLIVHHCINTESSIPAKTRVHNILLDEYPPISPTFPLFQTRPL